MWLTLSYDLLKNWKVILVTTFAMVLVYLTIIYLHPANLEWISDGSFTWSHLLWYVFIDQFLIECITVSIIAQLIRIYATRLNLNAIRLSVREIFLYELKFLPLLAVAFFVFGPFSLTSRYLLHYFPDLDASIYFNEYFYSLEIYLNYLPPVLLIGYTLINVNLIGQYNRQLNETQNDLKTVQNSSTKNRLFASDEFGEVFLDTEKIIWVEREERKTMATTADERYRLKASISELEEKLNQEHFVRINRSTLINLNHLQHYAFWENDKYVIRMDHQQKEFVMSRDRLNKIKDKLVLN
ncbi:MAG: LytTR family DNA-binding domain-containing protein [Cytophagales bacterium]|nr:LytTR family DNA-binding domain-containing protein [Cytophagales bacterium]